MAVIVLQGCNERVADRHAHLLVHHVSRHRISLDALVDKTLFEKVVEETVQDQQRVSTLLCSGSGMSEEALKELCRQDRQICADEALRFGFIDRID
jgi:ATP-dependent protease ClpP protease subunit